MSAVTSQTIAIPGGDRLRLAVGTFFRDAFNRHASDHPREFDRMTDRLLCDIGVDPRLIDRATDDELKLEMLRRWP